MAEVKWIKLHTAMFDNSKIKYIRTLPEGNNMVLIWVMLLSKEGKCNANGFIFLTESIPYTSQMLAAEFGFDVYLIELALGTFGKLNMIHLENQIIQIAGWEEHQNIEGLDKIREQNRLRKQKQRAKEKALTEGNMSRDMSQNSRDGHAIEEDIEEDIEIDKYINIYSSIISYLNEKAHTKYRHSSSKTKTLIKARLNEGFIEDDFKKVIDNKTEEWLNSDMEKYLRPETLFGTKFESYLNQKSGGNYGNNGIRSTRQNFSTSEGKFADFKPSTGNFKWSEEDERRAEELI